MLTVNEFPQRSPLFLVWDLKSPLDHIKGSFGQSRPDGLPLHTRTYLTGRQLVTHLPHSPRYFLYFTKSHHHARPGIENLQLHRLANRCQPFTEHVCYPRYGMRAAWCMYIGTYLRTRSARGAPPHQDFYICQRNTIIGEKSENVLPRSHSHQSYPCGPFTSHGRRRQLSNVPQTYYYCCYLLPVLLYVCTLVHQCTPTSRASFSPKVMMLCEYDYENHPSLHVFAPVPVPLLEEGGIHFG